jgi:transcriptional regulator with XRE-family HTH domain
MTDDARAEAPASAFGAMLLHWRGRRGLSQYALAERAEVSARHLSFLETGRSTPSREMVLRLGRVLELPFRERNALLHAAGFSPQYRETPLGAEAMAAVRDVLGRLLAGMEPWPAVVVDRRHDLLMANDAAMRFIARLSGQREIPEEVRRNAVALLLSRQGLGDAVENRDEVAALLLDRLRRELQAPRDGEYLRQVERLIGVVRPPREPQDSALPVVALRFRLDADVVSMFSTIMSVGTPLDVTLQELRIETLLPADEASKQLLEST